MFQPYFEVFYSMLVGEDIQNINNTSLVSPGYQLLPLETSQLMGENSKFDVSTIF